MGLTFLKRGAQAHKALKKAVKEADTRAAMRGPLRFWLNADEEGRLITFLDGDLTSDGLLDMSAFNQHSVKANGTQQSKFVCVADDEPCPLCEMGNYATLVSVFTVIDHGEYVDRNQKLHQHERKLFTAKRDTMTRLQKLATKHGGLTGWTVSVTRIGKKSPEVGTDFDFLEEQDLPALAKELKLKPEDIQPFDYDKEIKYLSADALRELGYGTAVLGRSDTALVLGKTAKKTKKVEDDDEPEDENEGEDETPFKPKKKSMFAAKSDDDDDDEDAPKAKVSKVTKVTKPAAKSSLFGKAKPKPKPKPADDDDDAPSTDDDDDDNDL